MAIMAASVLAEVNVDTSKGERALANFDGKLRATAAGGARELGPLRSALGGVENAARIAGAGLGGMAAAFGVGALGGMVSQLGHAVVQFAQMGAAAEEQEDAFQNVASAAGISANEILDATRRASEGMVSNADLVAANNQAIMMGAVSNAQQAAQLMEIAKVRSDAVGMGVGEAYSALAEGIGRVSERQLYALGINVDMEAANAAYAASLGKTADKLSDTEKRQSLYNAVVADSAGLLSAAGGAGMSDADKMDRFAASSANLRESLAKLVAGPLAGLMDLLNKPISGANNVIAALENRPTQTQAILAQSAAYKDQIRLLAEKVAAEKAAAAAPAPVQTVDYSLQAIAAMNAANEQMMEQTVTDQQRIQEEVRKTAAAEQEANFAAMSRSEQQLFLLESQAAAYDEANNVAQRAADLYREGERAAGGAAKATQDVAAAMSAVSAEAAAQVNAFDAVGQAVDDYVAKMREQLPSAIESMGVRGAYTGLDEARAKLAAYRDSLEAMNWPQERIAQVMDGVAQRVVADWQAMIDGASDAQSAWATRQAQQAATAAQEASAWTDALVQVTAATDAAGLSADQTHRILAQMAAEYDVLTSASLTAAGAGYDTATALEMVLQGALDAVTGLDAADASARNATGGFWGLVDAAVAARQAMADAALESGISGLRSSYLGAVGTLGAGGAQAQYEQAAAGLSALDASLRAAGASTDAVAFAEAAYAEKLRGTIQNQVEADRVAHQTLATARAASAGTGRFAAAASGAGGAADTLKGKFDDLSGKLQGMLDKVPGLTGTSEVTEEQLKLAKLGVPQNFADDYLRQLTDEVLNGVDWAGVDIKDAAQRAGIDPNLPAQTILEMFKNAWGNSSLFANAQNLDLINMDAVKADLLQQQQAATGKANLMALFGIGDESTVAAVSGLMLGVQQGLSDWLGQNGFGEQGAAIAASLGAGVAGSPAVGQGIPGGLDTYINSDGGKAALSAFGVSLGDAISPSVHIKPTVDMPTIPNPDGTGAADGTGATDGTGAGAGAQGSSATGGTLPPVVSAQQWDAVFQAAARAALARNGATTVTINGTVREPHDVALLAKEVARELRRHA